jgi:hypothetical protein
MIWADPADEVVRPTATHRLEDGQAMLKRPSTDAGVACRIHDAPPFSD